MPKIYLEVAKNERQQPMILVVPLPYQKDLAKGNKKKGPNHDKV